MLDEIDLEGGNIFIVDKPLGWTSFDAVKKIRNALRIKRVGHAGTLDPLATGILIVCSGRKTKMVDQLMASVKEYKGTLKLGETTPSFDAETDPDHFYPTDHIRMDDLVLATKQFIGPISQIPPIYSAITVNGQRLYKLAREGSDYIPEPRHVEIFDFLVTAVRFPFLDFTVRCSKGTYIRSLANDFGKAVGSGAYLTALKRTGSGDYTIGDAMSMDTIIAHIKVSKEKLARLPADDLVLEG